MRKDIMLAARLPNEIEPGLDCQHRTEKSLLVNNFTEINIIVINITILTVYISLQFVSPFLGIRI